nr:immunoglobulin light chain junction region [Macaca mulatta]MOY04994.1 immunoglobulin light chain junction region [Macaca mulatta]MOY05113.1 immunoglobulin light chain junction region [Macaca mulatta]MOY05548.1 immunoglobulin light chain junction region [Macaca mulatta]MOY05873.1 immunoglobulin light chain junction region [Macaca mulatta]
DYYCQSYDSSLTVLF